MDRSRWTILASAAFFLASVSAVTLLCLRAAWDVDPTYDAWFYHLPFAARLAGITGPDHYQFEAAIEATYAGFPKLAEWMQGWLWRLTGRPEAANFWALGTLLGYWFFLKKFSKVNWAYAVFTFLAVPLVLMHAALSYVDLPANLFLTVQLMVTLRMWLEPESRGWKWMTAAALCGAAAAGTKYFMFPPALAAFLAGWKIYTDSAKLSRLQRAFFFGAGLLVILAWPLKNFILFGNPFYPVHVPFFNTLFPYGMGEGVAGGADYLEGKPGWMGWLASQTEFRRSPFELRTAHDWMAPWLPSQDSLNISERWMGGNFSINFYFHTFLFAVLSVFCRRREKWIRIIFFATATLYAALAPQSNELRYYLFWILFLMSQNLEMLFRLRSSYSGKMRGFYAVCVFSIFVAVISLTHGLYLFPQRKPFEQLRDFRVRPEVLKELRPGEKVCMLGYTPYTFLYALQAPKASVAAAKYVVNCPGGTKHLINR